MRVLTGLIASIVIVGCGGSSTDQGPARYNFAVVDGLNQSSTAGAPTLAKPITAQLTRDPQGKFATRVFDLFAPALAYAQSLNLPGDPVAGQLVCGEESASGEPKVVPLCAYTLATGKAANSVQGGTKAGVYTMRFTAQVPTEMPVKDSTTVTVEPGNVSGGDFFGHVSYPGRVSPATFPLTLLLDQYGNQVAYKLIVVTGAAHAQGNVIGTAEARTLVADGPGSGTVEVWAAQGKIGMGSLSIVEQQNSDGTLFNRVITLSF